LNHFATDLGIPLDSIRTSLALIPGLLNSRTESGRARVGVTWKFGGDDAAVVARY